MQLTPKHIQALAEAEQLIRARDFRPYFELKELLRDSSPAARQRFRSRFTTYYGLSKGGLTDQFKDRFFEILFDGNVIIDGRPNFSTILNDLSALERRTGDRAIPFSFVSKLVVVHCESCPIYDKHVRSFFGQTAPASSVDDAARIKWFVDFLESISASYAEWARDPRVVPILQKFKKRDPRLRKCHPVRLLDFLVWKTGNARLLAE